MINIKIVLKYGKLIGIFILLELLISFLMGFLNLLGVKSFITSFIILLFNIVLYSICGFIVGKHTNKKGIVAGLITSIILVLISLLLTLIIFNKIGIKSLFYYLALFIITIVAATIGKNKKEGSTSNTK